ncbi:MAG: tetratricopeptide repeat protein [Defluviitaleaceae bacterium]|nr:tetratricopeptide repeat protein [Defluviitaleaceae bacterium]
MNKWETLAIAPTSDKDAIREAYMTMLPHHNPEDDPESFLRLRTAYEEALKESDTSSPSQEEITPHTLFINHINEIYSGFITRCHLPAWKEALEREVCQRLDMVDEAEHMLLTFLLENFYLPKPIWCTLSSHFDWPAREQHLKQEFPSPFIDYLLKRADEDEHPKYGLFTTTSGPVEARLYDKWISLFLELDTSINAGQGDTSKDKQSQLEAIPLYHPYYDILQARIAMQKGNHERGMEIIQPLRQQYPADMHIWFAYAALLTIMDKNEEAKDQFTKILAHNPGFIDAKKGILNIQLKQEAYESAMDTASEILEAYPEDFYTISSLFTITEGLIGIYEEKHNANPEDTSIALSLARYYATNQKVDMCKGLLNKIAATPTSEISETSETSETIEYKEIQATCAAISGDYHQAITLYNKLIEMKPKLTYYEQILVALQYLGQYEDMLVYIDKAPATAINETEKILQAMLYVYKCRALTALGRTGEAMEAIDAGIALNIGNAQLYMQKANQCWHAGRYSEVVDYCDMALNIYPYVTEPYMLQMYVFEKEDLYENMIATANRAEEVGHISPKIKCLKAEAYRMLGQHEEAREILEALLAEEDHEDFLENILVEMAQLQEETGDLENALSNISKALRLKDEANWQAIQANILRKQGQWDLALNIYNGILEKHPNHTEALLGMGNIYIAKNETDKAMEVYEAAVAANPNKETIYERIIDMYLDVPHYKEALIWSQRMLDKFSSFTSHVYVAILHGRLKQNDEAEAAFQKAIRLYPGIAMLHRHYGLFLQGCKRYQEAIHQHKTALEHDPAQIDSCESIAYCYQEEKDYEQALKILDLAQKSPAPYNEGALVMRRATIYEDMRRHHEALEQMEKAITLADKLDNEWRLSWIYTRIGQIYYKYFNNVVKAAEYFMIAIEEDADCVSAVDYMGDIYLYTQKDYEKAIECYNHKIEKEPDDPHPYVSRGMAYKKLKRYARAKKDYEKALELFHKKCEEDPSPCWQVYIANCKMGLKKTAEAKEIYVVGMDTPSKPGAWCHKPICDVCLYSLGKIYEEKKKYEKALAYYNQAIEVCNSVKHNVARDELLLKMGLQHLT